jgi:hypothetical protein
MTSRRSIHVVVYILLVFLLLLPKVSTPDVVEPTFHNMLVLGTPDQVIKEHCSSVLSTMLSKVFSFRHLQDPNSADSEPTTTTTSVPNPASSPPTLWRSWLTLEASSFHQISSTFKQYLLNYWTTWARVRVLQDQEDIHHPNEEIASARLKVSQTTPLQDPDDGFSVSLMEKINVAQGVSPNESSEVFFMTRAKVITCLFNIVLFFGGFAVTIFCGSWVIEKENALLKLKSTFFDKVLHRSWIFCGRYVVLKKLGEGSFGQVFLSWDIWRFQQVAVKRYCHQGGNLSELHWLMKCQSTHVVSLLESHVDDTYVYLIMPVCSPIPTDRLSYSQLESIAKQCLLGLADIQEKAVVHLDIKYANILLHPGVGAVIADFGCSWSTDEKGMVPSACAAGTEGYFAPEVLRAFNSRQDFYGRSADVYSLGVLLEKLTTLCSEPLPRTFVDLLVKMSAKDELKRWTAQKLVSKHKIFQR